jgi:hypothetical protein
MKLKLKEEKITFGCGLLPSLSQKDKDILLHIHISAAERNMFIAEHFLRSLVL